MSTDALLSLQTGRTYTSSSPLGAMDPTIPELNALAVRGLTAMFDSDRQLFCHRLIRTNRGLVRVGVSPRYTIMTLLGLRQLEMAGAH